MKKKLPEGTTLQDFVAYLPDHSYIFIPAGAFWNEAGVNAALPPVPVTRNGKPVLHTRGPKKGEPKSVTATVWLDHKQPVHALTWAPGQPTLIRNKLLVDGGWIHRNGVTTFNFYRPPVPQPGNPKKAGMWTGLACKLFPEDYKRVVQFFAHCVQHPDKKINHGLVLGGAPGIGKDSLIEPLKRAVGAWNFKEASPSNLLGRFNSFLQGVVCRVSELRDLGDFNRYQLYERSKVFLAAPPDTLRIDEKYVPAHDVLNVVAVILTSNHLTDGMYLPADDRRHDVVWSSLTKDDFPADYWQKLWSWYDSGGAGDVAAYLASYNLAKFNAKAPPPKTAAFMAIVDANAAPEDAELADVLDRIGKPAALTIDDVIASEYGPDRDFFNREDPQSFGRWLSDRKNRRAIPHRFAQCGYVRVRNDAATDGLWSICGSRQAIYGRTDLSVHDQFIAARRMMKDRETKAKKAADAKAKAAQEREKPKKGNGLTQKPRLYRGQ